MSNILFQEHINEEKTSEAIFQQLRQAIMLEWGWDFDNELDDENENIEIHEDELNRAAEQRFKEIFGVEY